MKLKIAWSCKKENIEFIRLNEDIFFQGWDFPSFFFLNIKKKSPDLYKFYSDLISVLVLNMAELCRSLTELLGASKITKW
jgi:hypothetical protein